jgi:broad-specificity NMP kinase
VEVVSKLAAAWEQCCLNAGCPSRRVIALAGLPAVGKSTCLNALRDNGAGIHVVDEKDFLTQEDLQEAAKADQRLAFVPGNVGLLEQARIYVGAEKRRCNFIMEKIPRSDWVIVCGGVEISVLVLELLELRGLVDIGWARATAYTEFAQVRTSAAVVLLAPPNVLEDRLRKRAATAGKKEDRSRFVNLVSQVYLPWLGRVIPRVMPIETSSLSPQAVAWRVGALLRTVIGDPSVY